VGRGYATHRTPEGPKRFLLQWHVTDRCNLRCAHCYQGDAPPEEPGWERLMAVLERFRVFLETQASRDGRSP